MSGGSPTAFDLRTVSSGLGSPSRSVTRKSSGTSLQAGIL